jgi:hypothetical protein
MKPRHRALFTACVVALGLGALSTADVVAADFPKSGSIHLHMGAGSTYSETEVADKRVQGTGVDNGVTYNDAGSGPLHIGSVQCIYAYFAQEGVGKHKGYCTWSDADGSKLYTDFEGTDKEGKPKGLNQIVGGTGKFAGAGGTGPYECAIVGKSMTHCKVRLDYKLP